MTRPSFHTRLMMVMAVLLLVLPVLADEYVYTEDFDRDQCTFSSVGYNYYFPLRPMFTATYRGMAEEDGELVEVEVQRTVLPQIEMVDDIRTRIVEEREYEDGELTEVSRNYFGVCRETGAVWMFGELTESFEDGELVDTEGWRAGEDEARAALIMPSMPLIGSRHFIELAPGVGLDFAEIMAKGQTRTVAAGEFIDVLIVEEGSALQEEKGDTSEKWYARGIGLIKDETLELVDYSMPPCVPDGDTLCLNHGRYKVEAVWTDKKTNQRIPAGVRQLSNESGEVWFHSNDSVELMVKVLDACGLEGFNNTWVFIGGMTNLEVVVTVTDTFTEQVRIYGNPQDLPFQPVLATGAFATCD